MKTVLTPATEDMRFHKVLKGHPHLRESRVVAHFPFQAYIRRYAGWWPWGYAEDLARVTISAGVITFYCDVEAIPELKTLFAEIADEFKEHEPQIVTHPVKP